MNLFTPINEAALGQLLFRRQFVLAPRKLEKFAHWKTQSIATRWIVHAHPDLGLTQVKSGSAELTLLGFCLNPDKPEQTDAEICAWLLEGTKSVDELTQKANRLGGRWVLIFCHEGGEFIFTDACGMRIVRYFENHAEGPWCFTQAEAVRDLLGLELNHEAEREFFSTDYYLNCIEHWMPGDATHYEGVKHLSPNHYLDLRTSRVTRFWPWKKLETKTMAEAMAEAAALLRNSFTAAARRFPLALPLTAGWDSRLLLAASKPFSNDIFYYTLRYNSHKQDKHDLQIPPNLMAKLGLPHHLIECPAGMPKSFGEIFYQNVTQAAYVHGPIVFGLHLHFPNGRVCLKGLCSEIARCFHYQDEYPESLDAGTLAAIAFGAAARQNDYAVRHFGRWLERTLPVAKETGYEILDLFQWEQKVANSVGPIESACDIAYETLALYNCRALLEALLAAPQKFRRHPNYVLFRRLMQHLWPETLLEPINPIPLSEKLQMWINPLERNAKRLLKRLNMFDTAKKIYRRKHLQA